jgi:hypothetical protein
MVAVDTFLTTLYVMADTFCKTLPPDLQPGPDPSLTCSEVLTLSLLGQWARFRVSAIFTALPRAISDQLFPPCPTAHNSTACYATIVVPSRRSACTW